MGVDKVVFRNIVPREGGKGTVVVFIHGLRGDPIETWRKSETDRTMPELLGQTDELGELEFYSYGYPTGITPGKYDITDISELLYSSIMADLSNRDIVFVAHSMGGLIVRQYIVDRIKNEQYNDHNRIKGVIFLSVPFEGSRWANRFPKLLANRQLRTLRKASPQLVNLEASWGQYVHRIENMHWHNEKTIHKIQLIAMYGKRDHVVAETSASPLNLGAELIAVDENHTSICKVKPNDTVLKLIAQRLQHFKDHNKPHSTVMHVHGSDIQAYSTQPHIIIDWTRHFDIHSKPKRLPSSDDWIDMGKELQEHAQHWSKENTGANRRISIYTKLCLPGGVLVGNVFSRTRNVILEVDHYGQLWTTDSRDRHFTVVPQRMMGNTTLSERGIIVLSVSRDIIHDVRTHLAHDQTPYRMIINMVPPGGSGPDSIRNANQAVAFAASVKNTVDDMMTQGIRNIDMYLNCPLSLAVFVGHYLTSVCPVQIYDFVNPGYTEACTI